MGFSELYTFWHSYGSDIQNGAVVLSAIAAFGVISDNRKLARRRGTMDLILHQESDRELVEARVEFNKIKAGEIRPSTYGKPERINDKEAQIIRRVLNVHELTAVAIQQGVIDECVYRTWFNTTFIKDYDIREISLIQDKTNMDGTIDDNPDANFESVDQIVTEQLVNIDSDQFNKSTLLEIYNSL